MITSSLMPAFASAFTSATLNGEPWSTRCVSLRRLRPQPRFLFTIRRIADQPAGQRPRRRANQSIRPAVVPSADGRARERAKRAADQGPDPVLFWVNRPD